MQTIYLDISNRGVVPTIYSKQGDVGRKFEVIFTDSGVKYNIPNGSAFSVWYSGESGEGNYTDIGSHSAFSVNENKVVVEMISQMLANDGAGVLSLVLNNPNGNQIASWNIPYICEFVPGSGSEEAEAYYTAFSNAVANLPYPDASLSVSGKAADAKSTGDAIAKKVPTTRKINGKSLSADVKLKASDVGAAPDGFGLGVGSYTNASTSYSTQEELDALVSNGFWAYRNNDVPLVDADPNTKYVKGINIAYSENHETQIGWCVYSGTCIVRERDSGVWKDWEFVTPPMNKNVEYRTTERYGSLPVYAKRVIYTVSTSIESGAEYHIPHNISNFQGLVRHYARVDTFPLPLTSTSGGITTVSQIGSGSIILRSNNRTQPAASYIFDLYYTKTTDITGG